MKFLFVGYLCLVSGMSTFLFQDSSLQKSISRGGEIYANMCVSCHLPKGEGVEGVYPPLAKSDYLANHREASIRGVKYGQRGEITVNGVVYDNTMIPLGLTDAEIADVMNYVYSSWGNKLEKKVTAAEVAAIGPR